MGFIFYDLIYNIHATKRNLFSTLTSILKISAPVTYIIGIRIIIYQLIILPTYIILYTIDFRIYIPKSMPIYLTQLYWR